ncbi:MAG: cytochrome c3 family protein [Planctomycetota bacterium]
MALLIKPVARRARLPSLLLLGVAATGCALMSVFGGAPPYGFSHARHAQEGLECADCHNAWNTADDPGMPAKGGCMLCHEELDKQKPPERRVEVLYDGDVYKAARVSELGDEVIFSHRQHATKPIECQTCHQGIATNDAVGVSLAVGMRDCQTCHREQNVANECATCHQTQRIDVAPSSHAFHWKKVHGATARMRSDATVNDCAMCHQESSCRQCHEAEAPDNHGEYFRRRGHGLHARMDRQNCAACHRADSCDECHRDTRPVSHVGAFGGARSNHCVGCHLPLQTNECATCHKGTPSHDLAPRVPPSHAPGMNCRQCHGIGQPLQHFDNGADCAMCHR